MAQDVLLALRTAGDVPQGQTPMPAQTLAVTGMLLIEGDQECLGFILRPQLPGPKQATPVAQPGLELAPAIKALASELGQTSLAELVRRAEKLARHHLVRHALALSPTDAAAALLLCVSAAQLAQLKNELALEAAARL
jgi:hypothetical protein